MQILDSFTFHCRMQKKATRSQKKKQKKATRSQKKQEQAKRDQKGGEGKRARKKEQSYFRFKVSRHSSQRPPRPSRRRRNHFGFTVVSNVG